VAERERDRFGYRPEVRSKVVGDVVDGRFEWIARANQK